MRELDKFFTNMESRVEDTLSNLLNLALVKKIEKKSIFFTLHNRYFTEGINYHDLFDNIRRYKSFFDSVFYSSKKVVIQYEESKNKKGNEGMINPLDLFQKKQIMIEKEIHRLSNAGLHSFKQDLIAGEPKVTRMKLTPDNASKPASPSKITQAETVENLKNNLKFALGLIDEHEGFIDPYMDMVRTHSLTKPQVSDIVTDMAVFEEHIKLRNELKATYEVNNASLIKTMVQGLHCSASVRDNLIREMTNLNLLEIKTLNEEEEYYPLYTKFKVTFFNNLSRFPGNAVREYYGEKITLYYAFLCFYRDQMILASLLSCIVAPLIILQWFSKADIIEGSVGDFFGGLYVAANSIFCVLIPFWCVNFLMRWQNYEKEFSIRFGQSKVKTVKTQRLEFQGKRKRNLEVDSVNSFEEISFRTRCFKVLTLVFFFIAIAISGASSFYLLKYTREAYRNNLIKFGPSPSESGEQVYSETNIQLPSGYDASKSYRCIPFCNPKYPSCNAGLSVPCVQCDADCPTKEIFDSERNPLVYKGLDGFPVPFPQPDYKESFFNINEAAFTLLEFLRIMAFGWVFSKCIQRLLKLKNLKFKEDHEWYLVMYLGLFSISNNIFKIFFVAVDAILADSIWYYHTSTYDRYLATTSKECLRGSCSSELSKYFAMYCLIQIIWVIGIKFVVMGIYIKVKTYLKKLTFKKIRLKEKMTMGSMHTTGHPEQPHAPNKPKPQQADGAEEDQLDVFDYQPDEAYHREKNEQRRKMEKCMQVFYTNPAIMYDSVNEEIEFQLLYQDDYGGEDDFDKGIEDYLSLISIFGVTSTFGGVFPISFITCWAISTAENYIDKKSLVFESRRPIPQIASTIGAWDELLGMITVFSVGTNSFYISFILLETRSIIFKFTFFTLSMIFMYVFTTLYYRSFGDISDSVAILLNRGDFIGGFLFTNQKKQWEGKNRFQIQTNFKVFEGESTRQKKGADIFAVNRENQEEKKREKRAYRQLREVARRNFEQAEMDFPDEEIESQVRKLTAEEQGEQQSSIVIDSKQPPLAGEDEAGQEQVPLLQANKNAESA